MQYETVNISLLKTSSEYYAKKRAAAETRYCAYCGKPLVRRFYSNGRHEPDSVFLKRLFCGRECYDKSRADGRKVERDAKIAERYRQCKSVEGLYVDRQGNFLWHGKEKKVSRYVYPDGRKRTALVVVMQHGKARSYWAARLVCEAFKKGYQAESMVEYIDGDIHNIVASNLRLVSHEEYDKARAALAASYRKIGTAHYQIERLRGVISGASAVLHYFETGSMAEVNRVIKDKLYPLLVDWCVHSLHYAKDRAEERTAEAIARFYEVILAGHAVSYPERYCKMLLQSEKKYGVYSHRGDIPKEILIVVRENLYGTHSFVRTDK